MTEDLPPQGAAAVRLAQTVVRLEAERDRARGIAVALEQRLARVEGQMRAYCAEELESGDRCARRAEFVLWGRLFRPEALGPRCWSMPSRVDQWAVLDLRAALEADQ